MATFNIIEFQDTTFATIEKNSPLSYKGKLQTRNGVGKITTYEVFENENNGKDYVNVKVDKYKNIITATVKDFSKISSAYFC